MSAQLRSCAAMLCLLFASLASTAEAQGIASSFEQLGLLVRPGDTVTIIDTTGRKVAGTLTDLSPSSLVLTVGGDRRTLSEGEVSTVTHKRHGDLATGAKWGFGIGAGLGLVAGLAVGRDCKGCRAYVPIAALFYGGIGTGIGVGISASISKQQVIYAKPGIASTKLTLLPLVTRERQGMFLSLGF